MSVPMSIPTIHTTQPLHIHIHICGRWAVPRMCWVSFEPNPFLPHSTYLSYLLRYNQKQG